METVTLNSDHKAAEFIRKIYEKARELPLTVQPLALEACEALENGEYDHTVSLCQKALDIEPSGDLRPVRMLLGIGYFFNKEMNAAKNVFLDLVQDDPSDERSRMYLGFAHHGLMEFRDAVRELKKLYPLKEYRPYFLNIYGDSLQYAGRREEARKIFREEIDHYEKTGETPDTEMLDGAYQNLLYLDVKLANGKYPQDMESYCHFLDRVEMTEAMQSHLAGTISYLSTLMEYSWYRPLFAQLVNIVEEKHYITEEKFAQVIESARISMESYEYHTDPRVDAITEEFLNSYYSYCYARKDAQLNAEDDILSEKQKENEKSVLKSMEVKAKTFAWNMVRFYPGHKEEFAYIKEKYPHTYRLVESFLKQIEQKPEALQAELLQELYAFNRGGYSIETFQKTLESAYQKLTGFAGGHPSGRPAVIHGGTTPYKRGHAKIGRNDPCPCGSGKKYKNCCGRNA